MQAANFQQAFDEDGFKSPTTVFTIFEPCPKCNTLMFKTDKPLACFNCGSGKVAFRQLVRKVYLKNMIKQKGIDIDEKNLPPLPCKVCNKIH